ncbi:MAG TPA: TIM barrel protein [Opitutaceae bacterium]
MNAALALSTSWCSQRHKDGYAMLREIADLGFERVELSHGIRITLVPGIMKAIEEGVIKVGSTHNFCPLPMGVLHAAPNLFLPSAGDDREREQWVRQTKRSIDFAVQAGAGVLVCHLGSVKYLWLRPDRKMESYRRRHPEAPQAEDKAYAALKERALLNIRKRMVPYWDRTRDSVKRVLDYAAQRRVRLGFENRESFEELPLDADFPDLLASFPLPAPVGYWHDTGHAHLKECAGLVNHRRQLEANAGRLMGFHLHDVVGERDHQEIGSGGVDFEMVSSFWRPEHRFIIELNPRVGVDGVRASKARVEALLAKTVRTA